MQTDLDLFVIARRIAAEQARAGTERLARQSRAGTSAGGPRAWLGRRLVAVGTLVGGEAARIERPSTADRHA